MGCGSSAAARGNKELTGTVPAAAPSTAVEQVSQPGKEEVASSSPAKDASKTVGSSDVPLPECRFRIFQVNDVYILDNFPAFKTCVAELSKGFPRSNYLTVLPGDFLAPSLLSSLDHGQSMIDVMNQVPVDVVCFGNHESDVPQLSLEQRISEFNGIWLNSNMPTFQPPCPDHHLIELEGGRSIALIGLLCGGGKDAGLYREGAFGGAAEHIVPVLEAVDDAVARAKKAYPKADMILPLTHQRIPDDIELTKKGHNFPLIIGGHDHWEVNEVHNGTRIVKAGEDAYKCAVIDLVWAAGTARGAPPTSVTVELKQLGQPPKSKEPVELPFKPDEQLAASAKRWQKPAEELKEAVLSEVDVSLNSIDVRLKESSMASFICTAMRETCKSDGALINAGSVRGKKVYSEGIVTFADLNKECPFPSANVIVTLDGKTLSKAVAVSREPWRDGKAAAEALHCDGSIKIDPDTYDMTEIRGQRLEEDGLYKILIDGYLMQVNPVLKEYADAHPDRIPPEDAGRPALPILVQYFCDQVWLKLVDAESKGDVDLTTLDKLFDETDSDGNGQLDEKELQQVIARKVGERQASQVFTRQVLNLADKSKSGTISREELHAFMQGEGKRRRASLIAA